MPNTANDSVDGQEGDEALSRAQVDFSFLDLGDLGHRNLDYGRLVDLPQVLYVFSRNTLETLQVSSGYMNDCDLEAKKVIKNAYIISFGFECVGLKRTEITSRAGGDARLQLANRLDWRIPRALSWLEYR